MDVLKESVIDVLKDGKPVAVIGLVAVVAIWAIYEVSKGK